MKSFTRTLIIAAAFAIPTLSFAQANSPDNVPAPQAQTAQQGTLVASDDGAANGAAAGTGHHPFAFLHRIASQNRSGNECVGPASFCNIYFGN
jgi:hypothetical protein